MKLKVSLATATIAVAACAALWSGRTSFAQEEGEEPKPRGGGGAVYVEANEADPYGTIRKKIMVRGGGEGYHVWMAGPPHDAIRKAAEALHDAESDEAKEEAREKLSSLLNDYCEEDMTRREP